MGGTGVDADGRYVLGDDALACLKDLKKWLKLYDEKANRLDVARCLAEANLVSGDLLEILAIWPETATEDRMQSKIALACLELLVPLTWPIEKNDLQMTLNHHRHVPYLQLAQTSYKRAILEHGSSKILRTAVRVGLPSMALSNGERGQRDEGIIKLLLYFFRNVAMITSPRDLPNEGKDGEISRSATINAFHRQEVLALILTISSNMGEDFNTPDTVILEILFHLLKGIDVEKLFMDKQQLRSKNSDELKSLLAQEADMHRGYAKTAPTRHNRFGTMIRVMRDDHAYSTVTGQDALKNGQKTLSKMDQSKKWNKPKQRVKNEEPAYDRFDMPVALSETASTHLRTFIEEFLDSSFNPLFNNIRRAIEREAERVLEAHKQHFFYLVSWFLEAERIRRKTKKANEKKQRDNKIATDFEADSFALIASVLNQESFVLLNRFMQDRLDMKSWREVQAGMRCFTQILLIVQEMSESPLEDDQDIAENIQNRIFYEESTHDRIITILRSYKDQGFGYLDACTELSHVFLRVLERYSRENVDLQVRSRRRARKSNKAAAKQRGDASKDDEDQASEMEDVAEAERVSRERKFDFSRFSAKFMTQHCVDTFVAFTKYYGDLDTEQLKRAHRFFYRVAFKQDLSVMLFRLDIISLFYKMIKGPEGLVSTGPMYREWDELVRQTLKKLFKKMEQRPELAVEMLFSKITSTTFYLEYGYEKQTASSKPRAPAPLEVRGNMTLEEQIGVIVAVLYENRLEQIDWVSRILASAGDERQSWEAEIQAQKIKLRGDHFLETHEEAELNTKAPSIVANPNSESTRSAIFKDAKVRLLLTLSGFERLGIEDEPDATWIIPSSLSSAQLRQTRDIIERHRMNPVFEYGEDDPVLAEDLLRRKPTEKANRADYDDDSEGDGIVYGNDIEEEFLFPAGGPTNKPNPHKSALDALKKKRRKRHVAASDDEGGLDDETREARRRVRELADLEKRRKIKSKEFVHDSDDESDDDRDREFFASEAARRKGQGEKVMEALRAGRVMKIIEGEKVKPKVDARKRSRKRKNGAADEGGNKRRKSRGLRLGSEDILPDIDMHDDVMSDSPPPRRGPFGSDSDESDEDTPLSSPRVGRLSLEKEQGIRTTEQADDTSSQGKRQKATDLSLGKAASEDGDDDVPVVSTARRRGRVAVFDDSDDE